MPRLLNWLLPKHAPPLTEREAHPIETARPAPSPTPELDEAVRVQRGKFAQEVVRLEQTNAEIRMALSRNTLDFHARPR